LIGADLTDGERSVALFRSYARWRFASIPRGSWQRFPA
jgi:hypothetical protein